MTLMTNEEVYKFARAGSTTFEQITPEDYKEYQGYILNTPVERIREMTNDFTSTLLQMFLQNVESTRAKNPLDAVIERFSMPYAGIKQLSRVRARRPMGAKYINVQDGTSVDPQLYVKPLTDADYFTFNDNYQNAISIPDDAIKTAVINEYGMYRLVVSYMEALQTEYVIWEREHSFNVLDKVINSDRLQDTQVVEVEFADASAPTRDELKNFVATTRNIGKAMSIIESTAFNIDEFPKYVEKEDLVMLVRNGIDTTLSVYLMESAFNKEELNIDIKQQIVPDFGGLVPTKDGTLATKLYVVYDKEERATNAFTEDEEGTTPYTGEVVWLDTNSDVIAVIMERGALFIDEQNPYSVEPASHNPRGRFTTYWANKPNVGFHADPCKNFVVIKKK